MKRIDKTVASTITRTCFADSWKYAVDFLLYHYAYWLDLYTSAIAFMFRVLNTSIHSRPGNSDFVSKCTGFDKNVKDLESDLFDQKQYILQGPQRKVGQNFLLFCFAVTAQRSK